MGKATHNAIGRCRVYRQHYELSQKDLAKKISKLMGERITSSHISTFERGVTTTYYALKAINKFFRKHAGQISTMDPVREEDHSSVVKEVLAESRGGRPAKMYVERNPNYRVTNSEPLIPLDFGPDPDIPETKTFGEAVKDADPEVTENETTPPTLEDLSGYPVEVEDIDHPLTRPVCKAPTTGQTYLAPALADLIQRKVNSGRKEDIERAIVFTEELLETLKQEKSLK